MDHKTIKKKSKRHPQNNLTWIWESTVLGLKVGKIPFRRWWYIHRHTVGCRKYDKRLLKWLNSNQYGIQAILISVLVWMRVGISELSTMKLNFGTCDVILWETQLIREVKQLLSMVYLAGSSTCNNFKRNKMTAGCFFYFFNNCGIATHRLTLKSIRIVISYTSIYILSLTRKLWIA